MCYVPCLFTCPTLPPLTFGFTFLGRLDFGPFCTHFVYFVLFFVTYCLPTLHTWMTLLVIVFILLYDNVCTHTHLQFLFAFLTPTLFILPLRLHYLYGSRLALLTTFTQHTCMHLPHSPLPYSHLPCACLYIIGLLLLLPVCVHLHFTFTGFYHTMPLPTTFAFHCFLTFTYTFFFPSPSSTWTIPFPFRNLPHYLVFIHV